MKSDTRKFCINYICQSQFLNSLGGLGDTLATVYVAFTECPCRSLPCWLASAGSEFCLFYLDEIEYMFYNLVKENYHEKSYCA